MNLIWSTPRLVSRISLRARVVLPRTAGSSARRQSLVVMTAHSNSTTRSMVTVPALNDKTREISDKLLSDDTDPLYRRFALSRAITLLESTNEERAMEAEGLLAHLLKERAAASAKSLRIGIAGPPVSVFCLVAYWLLLVEKRIACTRMRA